MCGQYIQHLCCFYYGFMLYLSLECASSCLLDRVCDWCFNQSLHWILDDVFSLLCGCHSPVEGRVYSTVFGVKNLQIQVSCNVRRKHWSSPAMKGAPVYMSPGAVILGYAILWHYLLPSVCSHNICCCWHCPCCRITDKWFGCQLCLQKLYVSKAHGHQSCAPW